MTLILSNDDIAKLLTMQECIDVLEDVYVELAEGRGVNRVRSDCMVPSGQGEAVYSLKSMDGVIPKLGIGAVRIDSDIVTWPQQGNAMRRVKVPAAPNGRYVGLVLLFVGIGYLVLWWFEERQLAPAAKGVGTAPPAGPPAGTNGSA